MFFWSSFQQLWPGGLRKPRLHTRVSYYVRQLYGQWETWGEQGKNLSSNCEHSTHENYSYGASLEGTWPYTYGDSD